MRPSQSSCFGLSQSRILLPLAFVVAADPMCVSVCEFPLPLLLPQERGTSSPLPPYYCRPLARGLFSVLQGVLGAGGGPFVYMCGWRAGQGPRCLCVWVCIDISLSQHSDRGQVCVHLCCMCVPCRMQQRLLSVRARVYVRPQQQICCVHESCAGSSSSRSGATRGTHYAPTWPLLSASLLLPAVEAGQGRIPMSVQSNSSCVHIGLICTHWDPALCVCSAAAGDVGGVCIGAATAMHLHMAAYNFFLRSSLPAY
jgi:hypothetical protein